MKQLIGGLLVVCALAMLFAAFRSSPGSTLAQDDSAASQSSAIADLQTRVAVLETAVAEGSATEESDAAERPALSLTPSAAGGAILFEEPQETGFTQWTEGYFGGFGANQIGAEQCRCLGLHGRIGHAQLAHDPVLCSRPARVNHPLQRPM